jgi:hypothetical protein
MSITSHRNDVPKESGGDNKNNNDVIRNASSQINNRISTTEMVWAQEMTDNLTLPGKLECRRRG